MLVEQVGIKFFLLMNFVTILEDNHLSVCVSVCVCVCVFVFVFVAQVLEED